MATFRQPPLVVPDGDNPRSSGATFRSRAQALQQRRNAGRIPQRHASAAAHITQQMLMRIVERRKDGILRRKTNHPRGCSRQRLDSLRPPDRKNTVIANRDRAFTDRLRDDRIDRRAGEDKVGCLHDCFCHRPNDSTAKQCSFVAMPPGA